jgi:hypothetical protein
VVVYDERPTPIFTTSDIKVASVYSIDGQLGVNEGNISASPGLFVDQRPRIAARNVQAGLTTDAMILFDRDDAGDYDAYATGYDIPFGGPVGSFCAGDGTGTACPCDNNGAAGRGCASSANPNGALLSVAGAASINGDDMVLTATGLPATATCLFFQGTGQSNAGAGLPFGDGLRCASGVVTRLGIKTASSGSASYPQGTDVEIHVQGLLPAAGGLRYYQGWYRNSASFCTASTFNLTNGVRVQWIP